MLLRLALLTCQPAPWAITTCGQAPRSAVSMQMDFMKNMKLPGMPGNDDGLSKEDAEAMEGRMKTGSMSFDDFLMQVKVMQKAGARKTS